MRFLLASLLFSALVLQAQETRRLDELMARSGLDQQLGQMVLAVRAGAERAQHSPQPGQRQLPPAEAKLLQQAMEVAYAPDTLRHSMKEELGKVLSMEDEKAALEWLHSDLGRGFTKMEEEAGGPEALARAEKEAPEYLKSAPPERVARIRRLMATIDAADAAATTTINIIMGTMLGMALGDPSLDPELIARLAREKVEPQRMQMRAYFAQSLVQSLAYSYRNATDAELDAYLRFAESPPGRRYHANTTKALDVVFSRASVEMGKRFQQSRKADPRSS